MCEAGAEVRQVWGELEGLGLPLLLPQMSSECSLFLWKYWVPEVVCSQQIVLRTNSVPALTTCLWER